MINVLLVDFAQGSRAFFNTVLTRNGAFSVLTAASPAEALSCVENIPKQEVQLLVIDLGFVLDSSASVLLQRLVSHPAALRASIVVLADGLDPEDQILLAELGVAKVLPKRSGAGAFVKELLDVFEKTQGKEEFRTFISEVSTALAQCDPKALDVLVAQESYANALQVDPNTFHLWGQYLCAKERPQEAVDFLTGFIKRHESIGEAPTLRGLSALGKAFCQLNRYNDALLVFDRLAKRSPKNLMHRLFAGDTLLAKGDLAGSKERFEEVLELDSENHAACVGLSKVHLATGELEAAFALLAKVRGSVETASLASYFNNAGIVLVRRGQLVEAEAFLQKALPLFQKYRSVILFNLGMTYLRLGNFDQTCHCFDEVLANDLVNLLSRKKVLKAYKQGGRAFLEKGEFDS